ncbi:MAG: TIGR03905 family TSCPD domain-containing protein [Clostridia bacterium]|nr:TIGR03905 family TSCPD domain-containing protein [Clostridia bacterium]MBQ7289179.1 TIGR03905 family TSCPD domain-containing protein [Clostridia bacterium]
MTYITKGTCSRKIHIEVEDDVLKSVSFEGGCNGNLKGISAICAGMHIDDIIVRFDSITCGFKSTSCPDQLAQALKEYKKRIL